MERDLSGFGERAEEQQGKDRQVERMRRQGGALGEDLGDPRRARSQPEQDQPGEEGGPACPVTNSAWSALRRLFSAVCEKPISR